MGIWNSSVVAHGRASTSIKRETKKYGVVRTFGREQMQSHMQSLALHNYVTGSEFHTAHARKHRHCTFRAKDLWRPPKNVTKIVLMLGLLILYLKISFEESSHPYKTAHIAVALKLMPTVLAVIANWPSTTTNMIQNNAVTKVLPARLQRRPSGDSTRYAPSCKTTWRVSC